MAKPPFVAGFDSASAMLQALARFRHGRDFPALGQPRILEPFARAVNLLPSRARRGGVRHERRLGGDGAEAHRPDRQRGDARWIVAQYPQRPYPAIAVGSSSGALVHLCAALGIPWLPQTLLIPVRRGSVDPNDPRGDLEFGREPARRLLAANPDLQLQQCTIRARTC